MRRYGIHGVVALAGLVACGRFGSNEDTSPPAPPIPDASPPDRDAGDTIAELDAAIDDGGAQSGFCAKQLGVVFCADFDEGAPKALVPPQGDPSFRYAIGASPDGRRALRLTAAIVKTGEKDPSPWGIEQGAFHLDLPITVATTATVDFEVMCQASNVDFVRLAGFGYESATAARFTLSVNLYGNAKKYGATEDGKLATVPMVENQWSHVTMTVNRTADDNLIGNYLVDRQVIGPPAKMSVKEKDGHIVFGFGAYDISATNTKDMVVWIDDVVLRTTP